MIDEREPSQRAQPFRAVRSGNTASHRRRNHFRYCFRRLVVLLGAPQRHGDSFRKRHAGTVRPASPRRADRRSLSTRSICRAGMPPGRQSGRTTASEGRSEPVRTCRPARAHRHGRRRHAAGSGSGGGMSRQLSAGPMDANGQSSRSDDFGYGFRPRNIRREAVEDGAGGQCVPVEQHGGVGRGGRLGAPLESRFELFALWFVRRRV